MKRTRLLVAKANEQQENIWELGCEGVRNFPILASFHTVGSFSVLSIARYYQSELFANFFPNRPTSNSSVFPVYPLPSIHTITLINEPVRTWKYNSLYQASENM